MLSRHRLPPGLVKALTPANGAPGCMVKTPAKQLCLGPVTGGPSPLVSAQRRAGRIVGRIGGRANDCQGGDMTDRIRPTLVLALVLLSALAAPAPAADPAITCL